MALYDPSQPVIQKKKWSVNIIDVIKSKKVDNAFHPCKLYKTSTPANGIWETEQIIQHKHTRFKPFELLFPDESYIGDIGSQVKFDRDVGSMSINGKKIFDSVYIVDRFISSIGPAKQTVLDGYYTAEDLDLGMRKTALDAPINQFEGFFDKEDADVASNFQRNPRVNHNLTSAGDFRVRMLQIPIASQARTAIISKDSPQLAAQLAQYLDGGAALPDPLPVEEQGNFLWHVSNTEQNITTAGVSGDTYTLVADLLDSHPTPITCSSKDYVITPWELKKSTTLDHFCWNHAFFVPNCFGCEGLEKHVGASTLRLKGRYADNNLYSGAPLEFDHTHNLTMPDLATGGKAPKCISVVRGTNAGPGTNEYSTSVSLVVQPEGFGETSFGNDGLTDIDWAVEYNCGECYWKTEKDPLDGNAWLLSEAKGLLYLVNNEGRRTTLTQMIKPWWPDIIPLPRGSDRFLIDFVWKLVAKNVTYVDDKVRIIDGRRFKENWQDPNTTWRLGTGDCEDMSMLMVCMLLTLGIDARLVAGDIKCPGDTTPGGHAWVQVPASIYPDFPATADGYVNLEATSRSGQVGKPYLCDYIPEHASNSTILQKWTLNRWEEVPALKSQSLKPGINNVFLEIRFRIFGVKFQGSAEKIFKIGRQIDVRQYEWSQITPNSTSSIKGLTYQKDPFLKAFPGTARAINYPGIGGAFSRETAPYTNPPTFSDIGATLEIYVS